MKILGRVLIVGLALGCGDSKTSNDGIPGAGSMGGSAGATAGGGGSGGGAGANGGSAGTAGTSAGGNGGGAAGNAGGSAGGPGGAGTSAAGRGGAGAAGTAGAGVTMPGPTGSWIAAEGPFSDAGGSAPTVVKLPDGTVLMIGVGMQAFRFFPETNTIEAAATPPRVLMDVAAALLDDGRVLVVGGRNDEYRDGVATCDLYDPEADEWAPATAQPAERAQQAAVALPNGDVLVVGGVAPGVGGIAATDVFRYAASGGTWETLMPLANPTRFPSSFLLDPETVLVLEEIPQVYSLATETVVARPVLTEARRYAVGVKLSTPTVLALGGSPTGVLDEAAMAFDTVEAHALGETRFTARAPLGTRRSGPGAVELPDGTVFVAGGVSVYVSTVDDPAEQSAERYLPATDRWHPEAPPPAATGGPAILLDDGTVFFANGLRFYPEPW
jgi:hypothetical protein